MKIGIISDTHDRLDTLELAIKKLKELQVEQIIHCGDWVSPFTMEFFDQTCQKYKLNVPVYSIFGNNEGDRTRIFERNQNLKNPIHFASKDTLPLEIDGLKIIIYHGHDKNLLESLIDGQKYDVVFTGHTHLPRNEMIGKTLVFNPGSTAKARQSQFVDDVSIGLFDTKTKKASIVYL